MPKTKFFTSVKETPEIFCIIDEFDKNLNVELSKNLCLPFYNSNGKRCRNRKGRLSESEIMTILVCYHFGTYRNFKEYYQNCIRGWLKHEFPTAVSYNRFVELMPRVFLKMMLFMKLHAFGKCTGITFVDSTMIPVCHNVRRHFNKVFKRYIIECINELLKNKANLVHSRYRSIHNFIMNLCSAFTAYCFSENKPEALSVYIEKSRQLELFA